MVSDTTQEKSDRVLTGNEDDQLQLSIPLALWEIREWSCLRLLWPLSKLLAVPRRKRKMVQKVMQHTSTRSMTTRCQVGKRGSVERVEEGWNNREDGNYDTNLCDDSILIVGISILQACWHRQLTLPSVSCGFRILYIAAVVTMSRDSGNELQKHTSTFYMAFHGCRLLAPRSDSTGSLT